jgi:hypothetical protein
MTNKEECGMTRGIITGLLATLGAFGLAIAQPALSAQSKATQGDTAKTTTTAKTQQEATLTGCLRADGTKYMLTDIQGKQAPKGRSWKTGFIAKTAKNVEVTGTSTTLRLKEQVGHKITVVGLKDGDSHLKARTVRQVPGICS